MTELWYYKQYNNLIAKCQEMEKEGYPEGMYTEVHHILPKCQGGTNNKCNLVRMPAKYHIFAHIFLMKAFPNNKNLVYAVHMMISGINNRFEREGRKTNRPINKLYSLVREEYSKVLKSKTLSEETKKKISNSKKGKPQNISEEGRERKKSFLGRKHTEETKKKISLSSKHKGPKGIPLSEDHKRKISESQKGKVISDKTREKLRLAWKNRARIGVSEETRKKLSTANSKSNNPNSKKVVDPNGIIYGTLQEISEKYGVDRSTMRKWIKNHPEKGFRFYIEESEK